MAGFSDYTEAKLLDEVFNGVDFAAPVTYVALFTVAPTDAGGGTEVTGGSYARVLVNPNSGVSPKWALAADDGTGKRQVTNVDDILFATSTADWGTIVAVGVFDAAAAGNLLVWGALSANKPMTSGDTFKFAAGQLVVNLD